jgi:hypothetical protein
VEVLLCLGEEALLRIGEVLVDEAGDLGESGQLGGTPSPFAGDDAVVTWRGLVGPHDDWLADTGTPEAVGERLKSSRIEVASSLPLDSRG